MALAGLLWSLFILLSFASTKTSSRLKAYFLGLSVALLSTITAVAAYSAISGEELKSVLSIAVDPQSDNYQIYASPEIYHLVRFYMSDGDIKYIESDVLAELNEDMLKIRKNKDIVIFAKAGEVSDDLLKKSRTVDARKFRLHLFTESK